LKQKQQEKIILIIKIMQVAIIDKPGTDFVIQKKPMIEPGPNQVRIKVHACGICHSDVLVKEGHYPGIQYPRVPGHEVAGVIDKLGDGVLELKVGDRVGVGWHGGHCFQCDQCRRGDFMTCKRAKTCGISYDGGYGEYSIVPFEALARIPNELSFIEAAPLMCAGVTVFNSLRHSRAVAGDVVAVLGLGGLGHLAVQFANKMGFKVVAISTSADKKELATKLGAHHYIDSSKEDASKVLQSLGGAKVIAATATDTKSISSLIGGLGVDGQVIVLGASPDKIEVSPFQVIGGRTGLRGWASGTAMDSEDTLKFAALSGVRSMNEVFPISKVNEAFKHMLSNKARFRVVLDLTKK